MLTPTPVPSATGLRGTEMATDPLQPIHDAKAAIAQRNKSRPGTSVEFKGPIALEAIADELTMLRAEITVVRTLLATIAAKR